MTECVCGFIDYLFLYIPKFLFDTFVEKKIFHDFCKKSANFSVGRRILGLLATSMEFLHDNLKSLSDTVQAFCCKCHVICTLHYCYVNVNLNLFIVFFICSFTLRNITFFLPIRVVPWESPTLQSCKCCKHQYLTCDVCNLQPPE